MRNDGSTLLIIRMVSKVVRYSVAPAFVSKRVYSHYFPIRMLHYLGEGMYPDTSPDTRE